MKHWTKLIVLLFLVAMLLPACGPAATEEPAPAPTEKPAEATEAPAVEEPAAELRVALVPAGRVGTEGFMFLSGEGYKEAAAEFGFEEKILESEVPEEWERNVRTAAQDGYDMIVGVGSTMADAVAHVAPEFPDTHFALVDSYTGGDNVVGLISQEQEGTFLAGALAAAMTSSDLEGMNDAKVIGFIGGMDIPVIHRFLGGLEQGAAYVDPDVKVEVAYVGSFRDPAKAKELALGMLQNQDVDIVYSVAGSFGDQGVFEAVEETGMYGIGSDVNWDNEVPGHILTSVLKHTDRAVYDIIAREFAGEFEAGEVQYGVASGVMDITDMSAMGDKIPDEVRQKLDEIKAGIDSGEIQVQRPGEAPAEPEAEAKDLRIALVPAGRVGTEGFMFLSGEGYKEAAAEFGFEEKILESEVPEEWERNVRTAAQDGYDMIVGVGSTMADAVAHVAPEFPDTHFALVDSYTGGDNVVGLISQEQEGTFLAGALAAAMTSSDLEGMNDAKVIGFIGGMDIPVIHRFLGGLEQGAAYVDPDVKVEVAYVGSFRDPAKAKELALGMLQNQDVDIVYSVAGSFGDQGVFEAVEETGMYGIGSDVNWDNEVPGHILTSVLKHTDRAVYDIIAREFAGEFEAGEVQYGVASGVMDITDMSAMGDKIPDDVRQKLDEIKKAIESGEIQIERPQ